MTAASVDLAARPATPAAGRALHPQLLVAAGQALAGAGNLGFALAMARLLPPGAYADLVVFLAMYLLLHLPATSLSAAGALAPRSARAGRALCVAGGLAVGLALAGTTEPLARLLDLDRSLVLLLAAAAPGALLLGFERGRLYGTHRHRAVVATLLAEPASRLGLGAVLAAMAGVDAAAAAVVAGGYLALAVALVGGRGATAGETVRQPAMAAAVAFLFVAVLQNQDLLLAKVLLGSGEATTFAVVSALGGAAAFATATIPLVLLPDAARGRAGAREAAISVAALTGGAVLSLGLLVPERLVDGLFGPPYREAVPLLAPYLAAMAWLGVARVLIAIRCTGAHRRWAAGVVVMVTAAHAAAVIALADDAAGVARLTFAATVTLAGGLAAPSVLRLPVRSVARRWAAPATWLAALMAAALVLRIVVLRGIWIDEAISISQAQLPWSDMLDQLRSADVHPPLYQAALWVVVRIAGTGELAVKLLSILAGVAIVPALYAAGAALYDRRTGMVAAGLGTVAPFLVWYSQEARMYSLFMLFAVLAVFGQVQAIRRGRVVDWTIYTMSTAALIWTQYFALLPVAVQQVAFVAAWWQRRRDPAERRRVLAGWSLTSVALAALAAPLVPFLSDQLEAYGNRRSGRFGALPSQAGGDVSGVGEEISVYAAIANGVWAMWGYHADRAMAQIGALWPVAMLAALLALGRRWCRASALLVGLVVVPGVALLALGLVKRDLFELRYFSGAVPALLLLTARAITVPARSRVALAGLATAMVATMGVALVDQQLNGANPRRYDFEGALDRVTASAEQGDVLLYEPAYLEAVVDYYAPRLDARPLGAGTRATRDAGTVFVLATDRVTDSKASAAKVGDVLATLEQERAMVNDFRRPNVRVWVLE